MADTRRRVSPDLLAGLVVGLVAAIISMGRLWWGDHSALTEVVWAEDGLFPLCVDKAGFFSCLVDPFAGYLLFLPRLVAGVVAALPPQQWALATNVLAALIAGVVGGLAYATMRRFGLGMVSSVIIGMLPVLAPVVGLEAINALGSSYMLLLYLTVLVLAFPVREHLQSWPLVIAIAVLLLTTTLTIPTGGIALALIAVQAIRKAIPVRATLVWAAVVGVALAAQWWTAAHAVKPRTYLTSWETFTAWVDAVPNTLLLYWPGLYLHEYSIGDVFTVTPLAITGVLVVIAILVGGVLLVVRGGGERVGIGLVMLSGLVVGAVPAVIGGNNNRYFVVPLLLWGAAAAVSLDQVIRRSRPWVVGVLIALILIVWWPSMPASHFRVTPAPPWTGEVERVIAKCKSDPQFTERVIFTPFWPPNWGDAQSEPTHPNLPCYVVWTKWM